MLDSSSSNRAAKLMQLLEARYAFTGLLGRGGSGLVFEVENRQLGRKEALKLLGQNLSRDDGKRFVHEAKVMAALDHPHIIPIYAFGENAGCLWYSMKLVEGPTLGRYLQAVPQPGVEVACQVAIPVLEALVLSHERGIVHRDIKPANILLDPKAGPLLSDFGIAKVESDPMRTETGLVLGTPAYVSPEQSLGSKVDGRTDLYALAVSLYQLLAGKLPFDEGNSLAIVLQRFNEEAIPLRQLRPDLPEPLTAIITRAMARHPEERFATAKDMQNACIEVAEAARINWQEPLPLPPGLGPQRDVLPASLVRGSSLDATGAHPASGSAEGGAPTEPLRWNHTTETLHLTKPRGRRLWPVLLGIPVAALATWGVVQSRRAPPPAASPIPDSVSTPGSPSAAGLEKAPTPPPKAAARPLASPRAAEAPLLRRAVTPPQLLETPKVILPEGSPCAGPPATVELRVDESGTVSSARLLSKVAADCGDPILRAARGCRFKPALALDGQPVAATLAISLPLQP